MKLSATHLLIILVSVALAMASLLGFLGHLPALAPYSYPLMAAAWAVIALGVSFKAKS